MGIFDFITRGPKLNRSSAYSISFEIAIMLYNEDISIEELVVDVDRILENIFLKRYPENSVNGDESRQIVKFALVIFYEHKVYLKYRARETKKHTEEFENWLRSICEEKGISIEAIKKAKNYREYKEYYSSVVKEIPLINISQTLRDSVPEPNKAPAPDKVDKYLSLFKN